jgi:enoyl-CoA hydratase/carnithine racemase
VPGIRTTSICRWERHSYDTPAIGVIHSSTATLVFTLMLPTRGSIDGYCVGGGLGIACAVDLRVATPRAKFGVPIARTLGNCVGGHP